MMASARMSASVSLMGANLEFKAFKNLEVDTDAYTPDVGTMIGTTVTMTLLPIVICTIAGVCVNVKRKYR